MISLLNALDLTLQRPSAGHRAGGRWIEGTDTPIPIKCSIQPYRAGDSQSVLPEGLTANDAVTVYTKTEIKTVNQFSNTEADVTTINGREYVAFNVENWNRHSTLLAANYKVVFVRKDKLTGGTL